jgi:hypothetical protein
MIPGDLSSPLTIRPFLSIFSYAKIKYFCGITVRAHHVYHMIQIGLISIRLKTFAFQTLSVLKTEGLATWFKALKEKRRDFGTRIACDQFYKRISSHKVH